MRRKWTGLAVVLAGCATAPTAGPLVTDRPDFTESAESVERGRVQVEGGYTYADEGESAVHTVGEVLVRVGLTSSLEARIGLNSVGIVDVAGERETALEDASLGGKLELITGTGGWTVGLLGDLTLPTGGAPLSGEAAVPGVKLAAARDLSDRIGIGVNLIGEWPEDGAGERYGDYGASLALGIGVNEQTGLFLETFGFRAPERVGGTRLYFDGGVTRQLSGDFQLDARVGGGEGGWFAGVGVARRW